MPLRRLLPVLLCLGILIHSGAEEGYEEQVVLPDELKTLQAKYQEAKSKMREPIVTLIEQYKQRLTAISEDLKAEGDVAGASAINAEVEAITSEGEKFEAVENDSEPDTLTRARGIFQESLEEITPAFHQKLLPLQEQYLADLETVQKSYTATGNVEGAFAAEKLIYFLSEEMEATPVVVAGTEPEPESKVGGRVRVDVRVQIDGMSHLKVRGDELWYDHNDGRASPPGMHQGQFPTYLDDDHEWMPVWNGKDTTPYDYDLGLATSGVPQKLKLRNDTRGSRGYAEIIEQPSELNDYTATIALYDEDKRGERYNGSHWIEFQLTW